MAPGARVGLHVQPDQQELLYILEGGGRFTLDGETTAVRTGDAILANAGANFGLANTGASPLRYLVVKCRLFDTTIRGE
jgi:mannose-6-phosphate isomerase-like protein (cupin superfamily)